MPGHDIIVIGFSAGGVDAMARLAAALPTYLPAAIFVVHHFPATSVSALPDILLRSGPLPALHPSHNQSMEPGRIYIARPAIDPLLGTAVRSFGPRVAGVLLSGTAAPIMSDGANEAEEEAGWTAGTAGAERS